MATGPGTAGPQDGQEVGGDERERKEGEEGGGEGARGKEGDSQQATAAEKDGQSKHKE